MPIKRNELHLTVEIFISQKTYKRWGSVLFMDILRGTLYFWHRKFMKSTRNCNPRSPDWLGFYARRSAQTRRHLRTSSAISGKITPTFFYGECTFLAGPDLKISDPGQLIINSNYIVSQFFPIIIALSAEFEYWIRNNNHGFYLTHGF